MEANNKAMREALVDVYNTLEKLQPYALHINDISVRRAFRGRLCHAKNTIDTSLAKPPRNCDKYPTVAEARNAFVCEKCDDPCGDCTVRDDDYALCRPCGIEWIFATAKKGANDGK